MHRLTVARRDYFLPGPVDQLKAEILQAVQAGGAYVNIPPLNGGSGLDVLFSPGVVVAWSVSEMEEFAPDDGVAFPDFDLNYD